MRFADLISILAVSVVTAGPCGAQAPSTKASTGAKTCGQLARHRSTEDQNKACLAAAGRLAAKRGQMLVLRLDDGSRKTFANEKHDPSDGIFGYALLDFYPDTHVFLVADVSIDDSKFTLVDGRTGLQTDLGFAYPVYSPDRRWIFALASNESGGDGPDLAVYDAHGTKPKKVWSKTSAAAHLPADTDLTGWDDDATVRLSTGKGPRFVTRSAEGAWHLTSISTKPTPSEPSNGLAQ